eukprot:379674_1
MDIIIIYLQKHLPQNKFKYNRIVRPTKQDFKHIIQAHPPHNTNTFESNTVLTGVKRQSKVIVNCKMGFHTPAIHPGSITINMKENYYHFKSVIINYQTTYYSPTFTCNHSDIKILCLEGDLSLTHNG